MAAVASATSQRGGQSGGMAPWQMNSAGTTMSTVPSFWDGKRWSIVLGDNRLSFGKREVNLNEVTAIKYWSTIHSLYSMETVITHDFWVSDVDGKFKGIMLKTDRFSPNRSIQDAAFRGLVSIAHQVIEPRLCRNILQELTNHCNVTIDRLAMSANGFFPPDIRRQQLLPWSVFHHLELDKGTCVCMHRVRRTRSPSRFTRCRCRVRMACCCRS